MSFITGGGGGSAPKPPTLRQINVPKLERTSSIVGQRWADLMRTDYGFQPGGPAWRAPLGQGALANMSQAAIPFSGQQDPQVSAVLNKSFGENVNLPTDQFALAKALGEQPLAQQNRARGQLSGLIQQWPAPDYLSGEDIFQARLNNAALVGAGQQQQLAAATQAYQYNQALQNQVNAATMSTIGQVGTTLARNYNSPALNAGSYYQAPLGAGASGGTSTAGSFGGGGDTSGMTTSGDYYG